MERWNSKEGRRVKSPSHVEQFLARLDDMCKEYDLSIGHEDGHGAFILGRYEDFAGWVDGAKLDLDTD